MMKKDIASFFLRIAFFSMLVIYFFINLFLGFDRIDNQNWWITFGGSLICFYFIYCVVFNKDMYIGNYTIKYNHELSVFSLLRWFFALIGLYYLYSVPNMVAAI